MTNVTIGGAEHFPRATAHCEMVGDKMQIRIQSPWPNPLEPPEPNARQLSDTQIAWLEGQPGHWLGRAQTRREAAEFLRRDDHLKEADYCLKVASEYEQKAAEVAKGTN